MLAVGVGSATLGFAARTLARRTEGVASTTGRVAAAAAALVAIYGFGMGAYMTYASRVAKLRARERLLDQVGAIRPWTGRETVLDVGCGRGLMLIGAARRLTVGQAVGVDIWRAEDQTDARPEAVLLNAQLEGAADRVCVQTADACALPFQDAKFDVVLSHWVVHNLASGSSRTLALNEMLRVLRPGGAIVLADIAHHQDYGNHLAAAGLAELHDYPYAAVSHLLGLLSGGAFRPRAWIGRKSD